MIRPVATGIRRTGVSADHLTAFGLGMAVVAAVLVARGDLRWGVVALTVSSLADVLDGSVAKSAGTASPRGAFFDSVADRFSDALLLGAVSWFLLDTDGGRVVLLPVAVLALSLTISYERAKAEALGFQARGGLMERLERIVALGVGLFFEPLLIPILWAMLVLTAFTAAQRFGRVWRQATEAGDIPDLGRVEVGRWRGRRIARPTERMLRYRQPRRR
ncbi:MAG TPA: CDP-alcohol phosphatidyltransferase family protein [Acidimicrobiales bacterium]